MLRARAPSETLAALKRGLKAVIERTAAPGTTTASAARIVATMTATDRRFTSA